MMGKNKGDAIEGEKIFCQARKIEKKGLIHKGRHRQQTAILESRGRTPAFCQIEKTFSYNGMYRL